MRSQIGYYHRLTSSISSADPRRVMMTRNLGEALTRTILVLTSWLFPMVLLAAGEVQFQRISLEAGLTQSSINAMAHCDDGYMWFGTQYGLNRYDGYGFKPFRHDPDDPASLSNSAISQLECLNPGHLWVTTRDGLNRFNTRTGRATHYFLPESLRSPDGRSLIRIRGRDQDGTLYLEGFGLVGILRPGADEIQVAPFEMDLEDHQLRPTASAVDHQDRFWLLNPAGLWRLDAQHRQMIRAREVDTVMRDGQQVLQMAVTTDGRLAVVAGHGLELIDPDQPHLSRTVRPVEYGHADNGIEGMVTAGDDSIWMVLDTSLVRYQPASDDWQIVFHAGERETGVRRNVRLQIVEDHQGDHWLAGLYGVGRWRSESERLQLFFHQPGDDRSIPPTLQTSGYNLLVDGYGTVWVGSHLGGLAYFSPHARRFEHIRDRSAPGEIPYAGHNVVRGIAEQNIDGQEYLWVALDAAGLRQWRRHPDGRYEWVKSFHVNGPADERLPSDRLWDVAVDPLSDLVWTLEDGSLVGIDSRDSVVVATIPVPLVEAGGRAKTLRYSADGSALWVATSRGLEKFHVGDDRIRLERCQHGPRLEGRRIYNLLETDDGRLLTAARGGLGLASFHGDAPELFLSSDELTDSPAGEFFGLARHPEEGFWVGSSEQGLALVRLDQSGDGPPSVQWFGREHGLVDLTIYAILTEQNGQLWLSSNRGLMRFDPKGSSVHHFTPPDGVQHFEFSNAAAHVGRSGRFYFGGVNGVNAFRPEQIKTLAQPPLVRLQEIRVNGETVRLDRDAPIELSLPYHRNDVEITFVGLHFADPRRVRYSYMLEGLDSDWGVPGLQRQVRYAGLAPGNYRFLARAANSDGVWSDDRLLLSTSIRPPPWQSTWAYLAYVLTGLLLLMLAYGFHRHRRQVLEAEVSSRTRQLQEQQALVRQQAAELRDALEARSRFFANISHEFRTPLTLIQSSLERLEADGGDPTAIERGRRYSKLLLSLVDQLLDLSRLRATERSDADQPWALTPVVAFTVDAFQNTAEQRELELRSELEGGWWTHCSQEHVEKILLNLLANAIKFTSPGDEIRIRLTAGGGGALLEVIDTGPGIPEGEQEHVFQQFQRSSTAISDGVDGSGLGLALVREMALAMGGDVALDSQPGRGSCFSVLLPGFRDKSLKGRETRHAADLKARGGEAGKTRQPVTSLSESDQTSSCKNGMVLVVEDNPDLRDHIGQILKGQWQVLLAADGHEGLEQAARYHPDLVVSDIMMPGLDGYGLLEALRTNPETSHIPVLLLTARQDSEARLKGFLLSADDFMTKPFNAEELTVRLQRILDNRERMRGHLLSQSALENAALGNKNPDLMRRDQELIDAINRSISENLGEPGFDVSTLCSTLAIERRTLQRKLKALTGLTPATYIRHCRLQQARRLLLDTDWSINEIALSCGFSSAQHFSGLFRKHFHKPPDQWRRDKRN